MRIGVYQHFVGACYLHLQGDTFILLYYANIVSKGKPTWCTIYRGYI